MYYVINSTKQTTTNLYIFDYFNMIFTESTISYAPHTCLYNLNTNFLTVSTLSPEPPA